MHLVLQELQRHLRADDLNVGVEVDQVADQSGVIRFGVAHNQHIDGCGLDLLLQQRNPGVAELGVAGVNQGGAFTPHQKGVVGGAVAQPELDVEAAAIPVERTDRARITGDGFALQRQLWCSGSDDHGAFMK